MQRLTLGKMQHPVRGFLHGTAALASVAGLVLLVVRTSSDVPRLVSMAVFGLSLVALYLTSTLYHSVPWRETWKARMQRLDHSMIFVLVAGTYTPIAFNVLHGTWRWASLMVVWTIAAIGILQKVVLPRVRQWFSVTLQTMMGWLAVVPFGHLVRRLSASAIVLVLLGGVFYTAGMVMFATKRPRMFPRVFSYHEAFHVLVVAGSIAHFLAILWYVVPLTRI